MGMGRDKRKAAKARKAAAKAAPVKAVPYHVNINKLEVMNNPAPMDEFNDADWRAVARMVIRLERLAREE